MSTLESEVSEPTEVDPVSDEIRRTRTQIVKITVSHLLRLVPRYK